MFRYKVKEVTSQLDICSLASLLLLSPKTLTTFIEYNYIGEEF
jgi:hypothetical protein